MMSLMSCILLFLKGINFFSQMLQLSAHLRQTFNYGQNVIELSMRHCGHVAGIVVRFLDRTRNACPAADDRTCSDLEVSGQTGTRRRPERCRR